jgi:hypothetical protein
VDTDAAADDLDHVLARVEQERKRLAPLLPEIDAGDLHAILVAIFRRWGGAGTFSCAAPRRA